ncbi:MAG: hypothetical protein GEV04_11905 [Actinophytocola sp.]|nr:hypothetical protein [Actinophytocola sp.]
MVAIFTEQHDECIDPVGRRRWLDVASPPTAVLVWSTVFGAAVIFWLVHRAMIDDAYITLTYARTLAEHGEWGMLPGHEANSATSPLNVLLLGVLSAVLGDPVAAAGVLYVGTCVALVLGLRGRRPRRSGRPAWWAVADREPAAGLKHRVGDHARRRGHDLSRVGVCPG